MPKWTTQVILTEKEREELVQITRRHRSEQQQVLRAHIVGGADRKGPAVVPRWRPTLRQVNRLKLIKRQMYGHANFDLLLLRVLHHDEAFHTKCA